MRRLARLLVLLAIGSSVAFACSDGSGDDRAPVDRTRTAVSEACPIDGRGCRFVRQIAVWLQDGDADALLIHGEATDVTCHTAAPEGGVDPTLPLCGGATDGEVRQGYPVGRLQSEGGTFDKARLTEWIQTRFGSDAPTRDLKLATIGCPVFAGNDEPQCNIWFSAVYRAPEGVEPQSLLQIVIRRTRDDDFVRSFYSGRIDVNKEMVDGGRSDFTLIAPESVGAEYMPYAVGP